MYFYPKNNKNKNQNKKNQTESKSKILNSQNYKNYQKSLNSTNQIPNKKQNFLFKSALRSISRLASQLTSQFSKIGILQIILTKNQKSSNLVPKSRLLNKNLARNLLAICLSLVIISLSIFQFYKPIGASAIFSPQGEARLNCSFGSGWAFDPDNRESNVGILVFKNGPVGVGTQIITTSADKNAKEYGVNSPNLKQATSVDNRYGFFFYLPSSVRNNQAQSFWIYALDTSGDAGTLLGNQTLTCPNGDATISANSDGFPLTIKTTDRLAGAIDSLSWNGKEFVNSYDHGRQLQYMWQKDGLGECYNPTEAGTYLDDVGPNSTSILNYLNKPSANTLVTGNFPGYWARPTTPSFFCTGATTAVNTDLATPDYFVKQVQIGHANLANVVKMNASINVTKPFDRLFVETPASFLDSSLTRMWRYNPKTSDLVEQFEEEKYKASIFSYRRIETTPPILSTPDGKYAVGAWAAGASKNRHITYSLLKYPNSDPKQASNIISISNNEDFVPAGQLNYESFLIIGTLDSVKASMNALYAQNPVDTQLPDGSLDGANCNQAVGWAWDPKSPNTSIDVEIYKVDASNVETILGRTKANIFNPGVRDLVTNDNGLHTFLFDIPSSLKNGQNHTLYARAINTNPNLVNPHIQGMAKINCPAISNSSSSNLSSSNISSISSYNSSNLSNNSTISSSFFSSNSSIFSTFSTSISNSLSNSASSLKENSNSSQSSLISSDFSSLNLLSSSSNNSISISASFENQSSSNSNSSTFNSSIFSDQNLISSSNSSSISNSNLVNSLQNSSQNSNISIFSSSSSSNYSQNFNSIISQSNSSTNFESSGSFPKAFLIEKNSVVFSPKEGQANIFGDSDLVLNLQNLSFVPVSCEIKIRPYGSKSTWKTLNSTISGGICKATLTKAEQTSVNWDFQINLKTEKSQNFGTNLSYSFLLGSFGSIGMSALELN